MTAATLDDPRVRSVIEGNGPSVVFVPLTSLRSGPGRDLIQLWGGDPRNLLLVGKGRGDGPVRRGDLLQAALTAASSEDDATAPVAYAIRSAVCRLEPPPPQAEHLAKVSCI